MSLKFVDRTKETTTTTGTGDITLAGAVTGYRAFADALSTADTCHYCVDGGAEWEVGIGTFTAPSTLARTTVLASSNAGAAVNFSAGSKSAFVTVAGTFFAGVPSSSLTISNKTSAYTVVAGDNGTILNCTSGTFTVSLTAAATLGAGFNCWVINSGTGTITIDPNGNENVDGENPSTDFKLNRGNGVRLLCSGAEWFKIGERNSGYNGVYGVQLGVNASVGSSNYYGTAIFGTASGNRATAIGLGTLASSSYSLAEGLNSAGAASQAVTGAGAMALGGSYASGADSFAAAVANNTSSYGATGANSIAMGYLAKASGAGAVSISTGTGGANIASGGGSVAIGQDIVADANDAVAIGRGAHTQGVRKRFAFGGQPFTTVGECQSGLFILRLATTTATPAILTTNSLSASATNQVILPNDSTYAFSILVVARRTDANDESAGYKFEGVVDRNGAANTTAIVGTVVKTVLAEDTADWDCDVTADTTNGGLAITVTGEAAKTIRWVATCWTSEVTG